MYTAKDLNKENRPWTMFCQMWWWVTDKNAREKLAAPLPPKPGYYWIRLLGRPEWSIAEYGGDDEWYVIGSDYFNSTSDEGIVEWRGPLEPPNE